MTEPAEAPPTFTPEEEHLLAHPDEGFPVDAEFADIDAEQLHQGELLERDKQWIDRREVTGGED